MLEKREKTCFSFQIMILIALIILNLFSCKINKSSYELEQNFTKTQIRDLNKITKFFNKEVLKDKNKSFKENFTSLHKTIYINGIDTLLNNIDYKKQKELYHRISKSTFDEIWEVRINTMEQFKGEEYIAPRHKGKFEAFLKLLGNTNSLAQESYRRMELSGDFDMLYFDIYLNKNLNKIDFDDYNNQLIISIYYLSMIDDNERDENTKRRRLEFQEKVQKQFNQQN